MEHTMTDSGMISLSSYILGIFFNKNKLTLAKTWPAESLNFGCVTLRRLSGRTVSVAAYPTFCKQ